MYFDRMDMLLQILRTVDESRWTMRMWGVGNDIAPCGFAGCAMGWAAQHPYFQQLGLGLEIVGFSGQMMLFFTQDDIKHSHFDAAAECVGISGQDAEHLFDPEAYDDVISKDELIKPKHVIARIEDYMRQQVAR